MTCKAHLSLGLRPSTMRVLTCALGGNVESFFAENVENVESFFPAQLNTRTLNAQRGRPGAKARYTSCHKG